MFEFDPEKSKANFAKHGIDFEDAQAIWNDDKKVSGPTYAGGDDERFMVVGKLADKLWAAACTVRGEHIRIISVRRARIKEVAEYEAQDD